MRILIAEDDPTCRLILKKALQKLGHEVTESEDGEQAWQMYPEVDPEVVITDWMMPGKDGLELCHAIRSTPSKTYTYVILLTALNDRESIIKGLESGADDYLTKPLDRAELQARLMSATRVTRLHAELSRLNTQLYKEGRLDPLTRVGNRRRMVEDLEALTARAQQYGQGFSVTLCDVDHFKKYNDSAGHRAGDEVLRTVAEVLVERGRSSDRVYRYGGEEFLVVMPEEPLETAARATQRRLDALRDRAIEHPGLEPGSVVTMSCGVSTFDIARDGSGFDALIERADAALYHAKEAGRDQLMLEGEGDRAKAVGT